MNYTIGRRAYKKLDSKLSIYFEFNKKPVANNLFLQFLLFSLLPRFFLCKFWENLNIWALYNKVQTLIKTVVIFRFRVLGRLESKYDETLMDYYVAFIAMCKRAAGMDLSEEEGKNYPVNPFTKFLNVDISFWRVLYNIYASLLVENL